MTHKTPKTTPPGLHYLGLDFRHAGVSLLEKLYDTEGIGTAVADAVLAEHSDRHQPAAVALLQTCNRFEVYIASDDGSDGSDGAGAAAATSDTGTHDRDAVLALISAAVGHRVDDVIDDVSGAAAVTHLFRVAAGLESMVVGEDQILAQIRAMSVSQLPTDPHRSSTSSLSTALEHAVRVGKRVRTETGINAAGRSTATSGLDLLAARGVTVAGRRALILGAGAMGAVVAKALRDRGIGHITVANRDIGRAERLAANYDAQAVPLDTGMAVLGEHDLVITCLGVGSLLTPAHLAALARPVGVLDLGVPRNVDPDCAALENVVLVGLDGIGRENGHVAETATNAAEQLVTQALADFERTTATALVVPTIHRFRATATEALAGEIARLDTRNPDLDPAVRAELHDSMRRVVEKVLHQPTVRAKRLVSAPGGVEHLPVIEQILAAS